MIEAYVGVRYKSNFNFQFPQYCLLISGRWIITDSDNPHHDGL